MTVFIYLLVIMVELFFLAGFSIFTIFLLYSSVMGSPYVPTKKKEIEYILSQLHLKKNDTFVDLGCGDGRVVRLACKKYKVNGMGIDINPILIGYARLKAKLGRVSNIQFTTKNILNVDLGSADFIYIFLMPALIKKLTPKLTNGLKSGTVIISHGFKILDLEKNLFKKIDHKPFPTYFYKIT